MSKVHRLAVQFKDGSAKMYYNDPQISLKLGNLASDDTVPYCLEVAGDRDLIDCARIAKLVIDDRIYTFEDAFIRDQNQITSLMGEMYDEWIMKLGLDAFTTIEAHLAQGDEKCMSSMLANCEFKSKFDIEKKKRLYKMQIAKNVHSKNKKESEGEIQEL